MAATGRRVRPAQRPESQEHESVASVMSSAYGVEETDRRPIAVHKFESDPAFVRINHGVTKNLGNYESLRLDVAITVPCYPEEVHEVAPRVSEEVARLLEAELEAYQVK
jgi:hypothetical protein